MERFAVLTEMLTVPIRHADMTAPHLPDAHPLIIQGGMSVAVSNWRLANAVSRLGQLGVIGGTALADVLARRLQDGDPGGHMRRALAHFPFPEMADRVRRS